MTVITELATALDLNCAQELHDLLCWFNDRKIKPGTAAGICSAAIVALAYTTTSDPDQAVDYIHEMLDNLLARHQAREPGRAKH